MAEGGTQDKEDLELREVESALSQDDAETLFGLECKDL
jgi:hypothetical protein